MPETLKQMIENQNKKNAFANRKVHAKRANAEQLLAKYDDACAELLSALTISSNKSAEVAISKIEELRKIYRLWKK